MKNLKRVLIIFVSLVVLTGGMFAAQKEKSQKKYKISFTERFRLTAWDNAINLDDELADPFAFTRHRSCFTLKYFPSKNIELAVKLTNEFRTYLSPKNREFEINEVIFDNLYLKWKNVGNMPLTLTLGRQNIIFGEGFIMLEGHPLDGSRSIYFNAVRADYQLKKNHLLTAFYTYVPDRDDILPRINDQERALVPQPETGLGLYYKGKFNKTGVEAYFIRKEVDATDTIPVEAGINALGARVVLPLAKRLALTGEGAYQFGTYGDYDRGAFGGYFHLDYKLGESVPFLKTLTLGGIYLAGDDPTTDKMEGWDPLFSRWPKWSESYIYTLVRENGVAYWTNFSSVYVSLAMDLSTRTKLKLTCHSMGAPEYAGGAFPGGEGKTRGTLFIGRMDYKINKYFSGHLVWEHFKPGNFYFEGASNSNWIRFEIMFAI